VTVIALLAAAAVAPPPVGLVWDGAPVHPACIRELSTDLADPRPVIAAVDLEGCRRSNRYSAYQVDGPMVRWSEPGGPGKGFADYTYYGALGNGIHVVGLLEGGGGSGLFRTLLFLRIVEDRVIEDGETRVRYALTRLGSETLGDRAQVAVLLGPDSVTIKKRPFRGSEGYGPEEVVVRTLR
jgi:hypothetical protein